MGRGSASLLEMLKSNLPLLVALGSVVATIAFATWSLGNQIHEGDLAVRQAVERSENRLRTEISELREDVETNYRDLRNRIEVPR